MLKKENLTGFIQIRVNEKEKIFIQLMAKQYNKNVSGLIMSLLYEELGRLSHIDAELNEKRRKLMEV